MKKMMIGFLILFIQIVSCDYLNKSIITPFFSYQPGPILFVSCKTGHWQLYSMEEDGGNIQQLTDNPKFPIQDAVWSPDGKYIAIVGPSGYEDLIGDFETAIYIMDVENIIIYRLTTQGGNRYVPTGWHPVWSPDSKKVAFTRQMLPEGYGSFNLFVIDVDGNNERQITSGGCCVRIYDWSPDGNWFIAPAWSSIHPFLGYHWLDMDGNIYRKMESDTTYLYGFKYCPDGSRFAFSSATANTYEAFTLTLMNDDGSEYKVIETGIDTDTIPIDWSPDGKEVLLWSIVESQTRYRYYIKNLETGEMRDISTRHYTKRRDDRVTSWRRRDSM